MANQQQLKHENSGPLDHSLILVAVMPSPRDMEIARVLGWYRIPYKFAPKIIYVDFLAFYQPSAFGKGQSNCIATIAPVRGVELTTRKDLFQGEPDHPRANEEYYKVQLGKLMPLPKPIQAGKWKRITFLYTTGAHLRKAQLINDLVIKNEERKIIWRSLQDRQAQFATGADRLAPEVGSDEIFLMMMEGYKGLSDQEGIFTDY